MAANKNVHSSGQSFSVDISAASKANDERIKVWTTQNLNQQNGASPRQDVSNIDLESSPPKLSLFLRRKQKPDGVKTIENRKREVRQQISESRLTFLEKFATWRFVMVLLLQSSFVIILLLINCLPMAMVCMLKPRSSHHAVEELSNMSRKGDDSEHARFETHARENVSLNRNYTKEEFEFDWSSDTQGLILTSISFPAFIGPVLGTIISGLLGNKWTMTISNIVCAALTVVSPTAAHISPYCLVAVRVLLGVATGINIIVITDCVAWWAPQDEKLTMVSVIYMGVNIGAIFASFLSGYLCLVPVDNGWPFIFYTFGALTLFWVLLWHLFSSPKPEDHPYISEKEKQYILSNRVGLDVSTGAKKVKPPYGKILRSLPSLAYLTCGVCHAWAALLMFSYLPTFFTKGLNFSIQDTGLLVSVTSLFRLVGIFFWTIVGNKMSSRFDIKRSRKICISAGFFLAGLSALVIGFLDADLKWVSTVVLIFLMVFQACGSSSVSAVPLDMAPRYASVLNGIMISAANLVSISGPLLTASIIADGTHEKWRTVWIIMSAIFFTGSISFLLFGQASLQPYAQEQKPDLSRMILPLVSMGRRFSNFVEVPQLSPGSYRKWFALSEKYESSAATDSLATVTPEVFYPENSNFGTTKIPDTDSQPETQAKYSITEEKDDEAEDDFPDKDCVDDKYIVNKLRASSESGLEGIRLNTILVKEDEHLDRGQNVFYKQSEVISSEHDGSFIEESIGTSVTRARIIAGVTKEEESIGTLVDGVGINKSVTKEEESIGTLGDGVGISADVTKEEESIGTLVDGVGISADVIKEEVSIGTLVGGVGIKLSVTKEEESIGILCDGVGISADVTKEEESISESVKKSSITLMVANKTFKNEQNDSPFCSIQISRL